MAQGMSEIIFSIDEKIFMPILHYLTKLSRNALF